ncbi:MAG TPA: hypothetical protein VGX92_13215 [Pyrinomonadaceae bacterium]|jgi:hypothetical protein|nr:hypothetical protein [Pyrinomonadaceae bacterium]
MMTLQNKILPVALVAALLGGGVGAFVTRSTSSSTPTTTTTSTTANQPLASTATEATIPSTDEQARLNTTSVAGDDQDAYRDGFVEGYRAATEESGSTAVSSRRSSSATPVVYRSSGRRARSVASDSSPRRVYYDYNNQPRQRSFWQKHRDKLTVAMGAGGGALIGGLIGGKKGAAIGALAGGGGSALYTYKIRKRNRNY